MKKLSIIIPAYNEERTIAAALDQLEKCAIRPDIEKEVIVVDDGSTDRTGEILDRYKDRYIIIHHDQNRGKGAAVRTGYERATGDYSIIHDADLEYDPSDIQALIDKAEQTGARAVYGSRVLGPDSEKTPGIFFWLGGKFLTVLTNFLYGTEITDEPTCYKMFAKSVTDAIKLEHDGFEYCPEITSKAARQGVKIEEVPISYNNPRDSKEGKKIKLFKDGSMAIWTLIKYRFNTPKAAWGFVKLQRIWLSILAAYLIVRFAVFTAYVFAVPDVWKVFIGEAQAGRSVLALNWHEACDWHPPLYYFFTTLSHNLFQGWGLLYFLQFVLGFLSVVLSFKIARLFFSNRTSLISAFLIAVEPYSAWHTWLLASENLYIPLYLTGFYSLFKGLKASSWRLMALAGFFFGLATLTRLNSLYTVPFIVLVMVLLFAVKKIVPVQPFAGVKTGRLFLLAAVLAGAYYLTITPWQARNYFEYGRFSVGNVLYTNMYHYNVPYLLSVKDDISYDEAGRMVMDKALSELGPNVGDQGDCSLYSHDELNRHFDYYTSEAARYLKSDFGLYLKMHLVKAIPFFMQEGYLNMLSAATGNYAKPDMTSSLMRGDFQTIAGYFKNFDFAVLLYLFGIAFWSLCSLSLFAGTIYALLRDRDKLLFFAIATAMAIYTAILCSPFVLARYRLPVYVFFIVLLVYMVQIAITKFQSPNKSQ